MKHSQYYENPDTGAVVEVSVQEVEAPRNARPKDDHGRQRDRQRWRPSDMHQRERPGRREPSFVPVQVGTQPQTAPVAQANIGDDYVSIRKGALVEIIPIVGQVYASFLGLPALPTATGDHLVDRDNAALHRDALARHHQNQTRILALSDLAARAVSLMVK